MSTTEVKIVQMPPTRWHQNPFYGVLLSGGLSLAIGLVILTVNWQTLREERHARRRALAGFFFLEITSLYLGASVDANMTVTAPEQLILPRSTFGKESLIALPQGITEDCSLLPIVSAFYADYEETAKMLAHIRTHVPKERWNTAGCRALVSSGAAGLVVHVDCMKAYVEAVGVESWVSEMAKSDLEEAERVQTCTEKGAPAYATDIESLMRATLEDTER